MLDCVAIDIDCIDVLTLWCEEAAREEAIAAPDIEKHIAVTDHLCGEVAPVIAVSVRRADREREASYSVVEVMRLVLRQHPLPPKKALIVSAKQRNQKPFAALPTPDHSLEERGQRREIEPESSETVGEYPPWHELRTHDLILRHSADRPDAAESARVAESRPDIAARARAIDAWLDEQAANVVASHGVGGAVLE
jgi:hypothetical protein